MSKKINISKISTKEGLNIVAKNVPDIAFTAVSAFVNVNPVWALIFLTAKGIYNAWGEFGQARLNELVVGIEKSKDTFIPEIIETDEFKSVFLSILERHMKESSDRKRELLRNYLISVGQGKKVLFDYHTKLLNILDQITGDELRLFMLLPDIIKDANDEMLFLSSGGRVGIPDPSKRETSMNTVQVKMRLKNWKIKNKDLSAIIRFLTNYGLIISQDVSVSGIGGGGTTDITFEGITKIGEIFCEFIDDPSFDKNITTFLEYRENPGLNLETLRD